MTLWRFLLYFRAVKKVAIYIEAKLDTTDMMYYESREYKLLIHCSQDLE